MKNKFLILFLFICFLGFSQKKAIKKFQITANEIEISTIGLDDFVLENTDSNFIEIFLYAENSNERHIVFEEKQDNEDSEESPLILTNEIKEVVINSTKLIGVLEVDVKQVPKDKFTRIKINGLPQTYEVGKPVSQNINSPVAALFKPVDFLYNLFGKKPKQLKKLQKLKKEDDLRKMLSGKFDREVMMEYLNMDKQELSKLLSDCNYSEYFIKKASDLQMIEAVLDCYENYKAIKKGKIERDILPTRKN